MSIISALGLKEILGGIADFAFGWMKRRQERKQAEHEVRLQVIKSHTDYDVAAQDQRQFTFLDELCGIWVLGMLTLAMFDDGILANIQKFDQLPDFLQWSFLMIIGAVFGWRTVIAPILSRRAGVQMLGVETPSKKD